MAERLLSRQRPYLLRAMHEWMTDNALTPHIVVDAALTRLDLPPGQVRDNRIVLNVSYAATRGLIIGSDSVSFEARFNGVPRALDIPIDAVLGIYARENSQGMVFAKEEAPPPPGDDNDPKGSSRPALRVVK
jgi:stringent starvation protein B